jgi:hypothetical protein
MTEFTLLDGPFDNGINDFLLSVTWCMMRWAMRVILAPQGGKWEKADDLHLPPVFCGLCHAIISTEVDLNGEVGVTYRVLWYLFLGTCLDLS